MEDFHHVLPAVSDNTLWIPFHQSDFTIEVSGDPQERHTKCIHIINPPPGFDSDLHRLLVFFIDTPVRGPIECLVWITPLNPGSHDNRFGLSTTWCKHIERDWLHAYGALSQEALKPWQRKALYLIYYPAKSAR